MSTEANAKRTTHSAPRGGRRMIGRSGFDRRGTPHSMAAQGRERLGHAGGRVRPAYAALAYVCIALALAGIVLPGLPTTPFVLVAAWAAARGCPSADRWLRDHRLLGPLLHDWETQRAVPRRAKWLAVGLLGASWGAMFLYTDGPLVPVLCAPLFIAVALFVTTRPAPRPQAVVERPRM